MIQCLTVVRGCHKTALYLRMFCIGSCLPSIDSPRAGLDLASSGPDGVAAVYKKSARRSAGGPILKLARLETGRNPALLHHIVYMFDLFLALGTARTSFPGGFL